jgi:hypothetical protein
MIKKLSIFASALLVILVWACTDTAQEKKDKENKNLTNLLVAAGQEILEIKYFNRISAIAWFLKFKVLRSKSISEGDVTVVEKILPLLKFEDYFPIPFGQSLIAVSRKRKF